MGKALKAVGYARISKDDTLEGRGVGRQTDDIAAVCKRHRWELTETITLTFDHITILQRPIGTLGEVDLTKEAMAEYTVFEPE